MQYCNHASLYAKEHNGKEWKYMIIPHDGVVFNRDFCYFVSRYVED
jgi:hypothetical protein